MDVFFNLAAISGMLDTRAILMAPFHKVTNRSGVPKQFFKLKLSIRYLLQIRSAISELNHEL